MTKHAEGPTAAAYAHISEDRDGTGLGVARQEKDCRALAQRRGWHVVNVYVDNDISAYSGKPRPQYRQMLDDIKSGLIRAVVVWHLDRLHRQPRELEEFIDISAIPRRSHRRP
jgi:site-specific DNA recombinase